MDYNYALCFSQFMQMDLTSEEEVIHLFVSLQ